MQEDRWGNHSSPVKLSNLLFYSSFLCSILFLSLQHSAYATESFVDKNTITVVVVKNFPPHYSLDKDGKPQGYAVDVIEAIAKRAGLNLTYIVKDTWSQTAKALKNGEADLIPNLGISESRKLDFDFSAPVEIFPISIILRESSTSDIHSVADLTDKNVGVVQFNIGAKLVSKLVDVNMVVYEQPEEALIGLLAGNVDALVYPKSVLLKVARDNKLEQHIKTLDAPLKEIKRAIAVKKGNTQLLLRLNNAFDDFSSSKKARDLYVKWYGEDEPLWNVVTVLYVAGALVFIILIFSATWRYFLIKKTNESLLETIQKREQAEEALSESEISLVKLRKSQKLVVGS